MRFRLIAVTVGRFAKPMVEQFIVMAVFQLLLHLIDRLLARLAPPLTTMEGTA